MSDLLKATDVARICQVDLKSIHNWCERRGLPHFRTPGRHLRFRAAELAPWLRRFGFEVPAEVAAHERAAGVVHYSEHPCTGFTDDPERVTCLCCRALFVEVEVTTDEAAA